MNIMSAICTRLFGGSQMLLKAICTVFVLFIANSAYASDYRFETLRISDGLPSLNINQIYQQENGFVWFATDSGVSRYNGKDFLHFKYNPGEKNHISNNYVNEMVEDDDGNLWFSTEDGLNKLKFDGSMTYYKNDSTEPLSISSNLVSTMFKDSSGTLWLGFIDGLSTYDKTLDGFKKVPIDSALGAMNANVSIYDIFEDHQGTLYASTSNGLAILNIKTNRFEDYVPKNSLHNNLVRDHIYAALVDRNSVIWMGTKESGLYSLNPITQEINVYSNEKENESSLAENTVFSLAEFKDGSIWVGHYNSGISIMDPDDKTFTRVQYREFDDFSLPGNSIMNLFVDDSDIVWISTTAGVAYYSPLKRSADIYKKNPSGSGISDNFIYSVTSTKNDAWIATKKEINKVNTLSGLITKFSFNDAPGSRMWAVAKGSDNLWVAHSKGLSHIDLTLNKIVTFGNEKDNKYNLPASDNYTIVSDSAGGVWVTGYNSGVYNFHPDKGVVKQFLDKKGNPYHDNSTYTLDMIVSEDGLIWLATTSGVFSVNTTTGDYNHFSLGSNQSNIRAASLTQDKNGNIWIATQGLGLAKITQDKDRVFSIEYINTSDGLPKNKIKTVISDNDFLWLTTENELIRYEVTTKTFLVFPSLISDKDVSFTEAGIEVNGDNLFLGTNNGFVVVDKPKLTGNEYMPPVHILAIKTGNKKSYIYGKNNTDDVFTLDFKENSAKFYYASLDYASPEQNKYRYMLEGFDKEWVFADNMTQASYTNLDSGIYTFKVQGSNSDGVWSNKEAEFSFKVRHGSAFYIIVSLITFSILMIGFYWYSRQQKRRELYKRANFDSLTGLANRDRFHVQLDQLLAQKNAKCALLYIDLDHFKEVNDSKGHTVGDELLMMVGQRLKSCLRSSDMLARLSGDEFAIVISNPNENGKLNHILERVHTQLNTDYKLADIIIKGSSSIGVACYPSDGKDSEELLKNADIAMYAAKDAGRNSVYHFNDDLSKELQEKLNIRSKLHNALAEDQFTLVYQPKVSCETGKIVGFEALLRWIHPEMGFISPAVFIPEAESNGTIVDIGEWVLREACVQANIWHKNGLLESKMSVNLSPVQICQTDLIERIKNILTETGLPANKLELEMTETVLMDNVEIAEKTFKALKALNINIALDDFGTGFSSLSYLTKFPFDTLKIDRSFVSEMENDDATAMVIKNIFSLAKDLDMEVVAEGVETASQRDLITKHRCKMIQGYFYSPPVSADKATYLLIHGLDKATK